MCVKMFELIAIADLNSQFNHCRLTLKGFNLGIPHIDAVISEIGCPLPHGQSLQFEYSPGKSGDDSMCVVEFQLTGTKRSPSILRSDTLAGGEIRLLRVTTPIILLQEWGYNSYVI